MTRRVWLLESGWFIILGAVTLALLATQLAGPGQVVVEWWS